MLNRQIFVSWVKGQNIAESVVKLGARLHLLRAVCTFLNRTAAMASGELENYEWERIPDMPTPRCYSVAAHHDGKLYVLGGAIN